MKEIGETIRNRRIALKINQQTLADLAGISINTLVAIERGTGNPSIGTLVAVLDVLGLSITCQLKNLV